MNEDHIKEIIRKRFPHFSICDKVADEIWEYVNHNYVGWHEILDVNNLPQEEVVAANFKPRTMGFKEVLVGWLYYEEDIVSCRDEYQELLNVTHYMPIRDIDLYSNKLP